MDISSFLSEFFNILLTIVSWCFNTLDSITFFGTSLLRVFIAIPVLYVILELMLTLIKSKGSKEVRSNKGD